MNELTEAVLRAAAAGDPEAIETVMAHYQRDIDAQCTRTARKKDGTLVRHIDEDMRNQIKHMFLRDLQKRFSKE